MSEPVTRVFGRGKAEALSLSSSGILGGSSCVQLSSD